MIFFNTFQGRLLFGDSFYIGFRFSLVAVGVGHPGGSQADPGKEADTSLPSRNSSYIERISITSYSLKDGSGVSKFGRRTFFVRKRDALEHKTPRNGLSMKEFRERLQAGGFTVEKGESDSPLPGTMHWHVHYSDPDLDGITAYIDLFVEPTGVPDVNEVLPRAAFQLHSLPMTVTSETLYWIRTRTSNLDHSPGTSPLITHLPGSYDAPLVPEMLSDPTCSIVQSFAFR